MTGYDVSAPSLELARERAHAPNLEFVNASAESIPLEPSFDLITTFDVIHDLADEECYVPQVSLRCLNDGLRYPAVCCRLPLPW